MCGYCVDEPDRDFMPYNPVDDSWGILRLTPGAEGYRIRHCSVWDPIRSRLLVFGGEHPMYGGNPSQALYWQRVWAVDPVYDRWTILPDGGNLPQRRSWFVSGYDPYLDALVVYGGVAIEALPSHNYGVTGELWAYLISAGKWVRLDEGELPPRVAAAGVYCASRGQIIAFGGLSTDPFVPGAKEIHNETIVIPVEVPGQFHWTGGALLRGARGSRTALVQLPKASSGISNVRLLDAASGQVLSVADTARELSARVWRVTFPPVSPEELQAGAAGRLVASGFLVQESRAFLAPVGEPSRDETWVDDVSGGASSTSQTESGLRVSCRRGPSGWNILVSGTSTEPSLVVVDVRGRVVGHLEGGSPVAGTAYIYTWPGQWSG
jgi:hypothetical protein